MITDDFRNFNNGEVGDILDMGLKSEQTLPRATRRRLSELARLHFEANVGRGKTTAYRMEGRDLYHLTAEFADKADYHRVAPYSLFQHLTSFVGEQFIKGFGAAVLALAESQAQAVNEESDPAARAFWVGLREIASKLPKCRLLDKQSYESVARVCSVLCSAEYDRLATIPDNLEDWNAWAVASALPLIGPWAATVLDNIGSLEAQYNLQFIRLRCVL